MNARVSTATPSRALRGLCLRLACTAKQHQRDETGHEAYSDSKQRSRADSGQHSRICTDDETNAQYDGGKDGSDLPIEPGRTFFDEVRHRCAFLYIQRI